MPVESTCFATSIEGKVAHIRFKRPEKLNSMIPEFWNDLPQIVREIDRQAQARVIVLSSMGKHFTSGMDLAVFAREDGPGKGKSDPHLRADKFRRDLHTLQGSFSCLAEARMPVIACIQGGCIGGGVDLISACDIRYAT